MRKHLIWVALAASVAHGQDAAPRPELLDRPPIAYPSAARGAAGFVSIDVEILADGSVGERRVDRSSGIPALDQAALEGVRHWIYRPARDASGKAVAAHRGEVVEFDPKDVYESRRLGRIWSRHRSFVTSNGAIFARCELLGLDTKPARAAVTPETATSARILKLEQRLRDELRAAGHPDPEKSIAAVGDGIDRTTIANIEQSLGPVSAPAAKKRCQDTLTSMLELGFFYPGSEELLEF